MSPYTVAMLPLLLSAHNGVIAPRTGPELSDVALAVFAAMALWFVRRAMRARFGNADSQKD